ncbi:hydrolytic ATP binding site of dynein motor region D1-domain-containing protein [Pavlovales sp. CCMP2436]|nr:hydrolytic ATP binding site of dynein motor region D1-domain-containing protein [Pavlovales sp. CCMP2436]
MGLGALIAQLRYYDMDAAGVEPPAGGGGGKAAAGSAVGGRLHVSMVSATRPFAFEYLGTTTRLIVTPLTDRCYQTLLGAIHLNLGGAPEGPAGTGKTETVKDLAKAVATQCVVFNCSEGLDQILSIQIALGGGVGVFSFEGTTLRLHAGCAVFITMNPGYAGRAELPDNLQALFRPCAMMMPDCALIAEISLHAGGFHEARTCAAKLVGCLRLCSEQLSSRDHYDWGMRAVKAVIIAAAVLKAQLRERRSSVDSLPERASADWYEQHRVWLHLAWYSLNLQKICAGDDERGGGAGQRQRQCGRGEWGAEEEELASASAPSGRLPELADAIGTACESLRLQPLPPFVAKCEQLNATLGTRHGVMLIGGAMAGKTAALRALREALALVGAPRDKLPLLVTHRLNPKALPLSQLYGAFDTASREWTDGVVAELMRGLVDGARRAAEATEALAVYLQPPPWRGWLVFDGPVDALWIESMNTALDDSKRLCLASGEVIRLPEGISLIFEAADLAAASPATVSRTGMVFFEAENLGWRALVRSWLGRLPKVLALNAPDLERCAEALLPPLLAVALSASKALISSSELTLVTSFLALIDALLRPHLSADEDADAAAAASKTPPPSAAFVSAADETAREDEAAVEDATSSAESSLASSRQQSRRASRMDTLERQNSLLTAAASDPSTDAQAMRAGSSGHFLGTKPSAANNCEFRDWLQQWVEGFGRRWTGLPFGTKPSVPQRLIAPNAISGLATFAALWALGGPLDAVARARVCAKLAELCSVKSAGNTPPHIDGALPGVVTLPAFDGSLFDFSFDAARNEWTPWVPPGEPVPPTAGTPFAQIVIPTAESARIGYLLRALCDAGTHALLVGESGVGKSTIVRQALGPGGWGGALGKSGRPPLQIAIPFSARTPATLLRAVVDSRMRKRRRGVYGPPHVGQRALVYSPSAPGEFRALVDTQLVGTMRPEGTGAAQSLPPRLRRHLVALGLAPASAADLERVYGAIVSAHLTTGALDEVRTPPPRIYVHTLGASVVRATVALFVAAREALLPTPTKPHYTFNARDVASVAEGVVGVPASALSSREALLRLW